MNRTNVSLKAKIGKRVIALEIIGFILVLAASWLTERLEPPYELFNIKYTPADLFELAIESSIIIILCVFVVYVTRRLLNQIKYLEGFMIICASCKNVKINDAWVAIDKIISEKSELRFSHGICPACAGKLYGDVLKGKARER